MRHSRNTVAHHIRGTVTAQSWHSRGTVAAQSWHSHCTIVAQSSIFFIEPESMAYWAEFYWPGWKLIFNGIISVPPGIRWCPIYDMSTRMYLLHTYFFVEQAFLVYQMYEGNIYYWCIICYAISMRYACFLCSSLKVVIGIWYSCIIESDLLLWISSFARKKSGKAGISQIFLSFFTFIHTRCETRLYYYGFKKPIFSFMTNLPF